jgi:hypothetical protein
VFALGIAVLQQQVGVDPAQVEVVGVGQDLLEQGVGLGLLLGGLLLGGLAAIVPAAYSGLHHWEVYTPPAQHVGGPSG